MPNFGPYTGDPSKFHSYYYGKHWQDMIGFKFVSGIDEYNHYFGGHTWELPICSTCREPLHQIITLDLNDPRLKSIKTDEMTELPLVSCLNCSVSWKPQVFKLNPQERSVIIYSENDKYNWRRKEENKLPVPLPKLSMKLVEMDECDIPINEENYWNAFDRFGSDYIFRLLGAPLYAQQPLDRECPICKSEMIYVATVTGEMYGNSGNLISGLDFILGESYLYFSFCKNCLTLKTEMQGT